MEEHQKAIAEHEAESARALILWLVAAGIGFVMFCGGMAWAAWLAG